MIAREGYYYHLRRRTKEENQRPWSVIEVSRLGFIHMVNVWGMFKVFTPQEFTEYFTEYNP